MLNQTECGYVALTAVCLCVVRDQGCSRSEPGVRQEAGQFGILPGKTQQ